MSAPFKTYDPDQILLFPPNLREWLPAGHLAYFLLDVVAHLDLGGIYAYYDFEAVKDKGGRVVGQRAKSNRGRPAYDPRMMTTLLLYAYVTGSPSSRQIEKKCLEDVAFRVLSANQKPDHATIAEFRQVHLEALGRLFLQGLRLCQEAGLVKLGHVALDGTKVKANASKHKAMSYGHMVKREKELEQEVEVLLRQARETDRAEDQKYGKGRRGDELPEELERREKEGEPAKPGRKAGPSEVPKDKAQRNFTDPESRIMKNADKAYIQGYNAQAAVDRERQVIVACEVTNQAADAPHLGVMVEGVEANLGKCPRQLSADAGYFSEENVKTLQERSIDPLVAAQRLKHGERPPAPRGRIPVGASVKERMIRKLRTVAGRAAYALRKITVEPVFGQIRTRGLARFWLRGLQKVKAEWALWCMGHNLLKLFRNGGLAACRA